MQRVQPRSQGFSPPSSGRGRLFPPAPSVAEKSPGLLGMRLEQSEGDAPGPKEITCAMQNISFLSVHLASDFSPYLIKAFFP